MNLLRLGTRQFVLCTSERSLLSVVLPARGLKTVLSARLHDALSSLLADLGVAESVVKAELKEMQVSCIAATANRVVLGSMNDLAVHLEAALLQTPSLPLEVLSRELSDVLCGPLGNRWPGVVAAELLQGSHGGRLTRP